MQLCSQIDSSLIIPATVSPPCSSLILLESCFQLARSFVCSAGFHEVIRAFEINILGAKAQKRVYECTNHPYDLYTDLSINYI